jgi:hypothetical protein
MALTRISPSEYTIDTPGFAESIFTAASPQYLALPDAVRFARERNSVLQSAREAVAFRIAAQGEDHANDYQVTRTAAFYVKNKGKFFVAFDDDPTENILLARAQEGYDAHYSKGKWLVCKDDPLIRAALGRAEKTGRNVPVPLENAVELATTARNGASEYGTSNLIRATIGDLAEPYAAFLNHNNHRTGYEFFLTPSTLQKIGLDEEHVEVRRVGVGGGSDGSDLGAGGQCVNGGRARGVRKTSIGNKG